MGGKVPDETSASKLQTQIGQQLFQQTNPLRSDLIDRSTKFIDGGLDVTNTPAYQAIKLGADANFNQAKDNIIARTAPGGALTQSLADAEFQRAGALTQAGGQLYGDELSRAIALGTGITDQSLNSIANAGAIQGQLASARAEQSAGKAGGLGQAAGSYFGSK